MSWMLPNYMRYSMSNLPLQFTSYRRNQAMKALIGNLICIRKKIKRLYPIFDDFFYFQYIDRFTFFCFYRYYWFKPTEDVCCMHVQELIESLRNTVLKKQIEHKPLFVEKDYMDKY